MFYSNQILARKGPLGLVWLAAHLDRQLKRQQVNAASIPASVDSLLDPEVPLALRLSGQLLLGVVRIYARKVGYLQQDCSDALLKIRVALRPADAVSLAPGVDEAPVECITLLPASGRGSLRLAGRRGGTAAARAAAGSGTEDGLLLLQDDLCWEQDVLLGDDAGLMLAGLDLAGGGAGLLRVPVPSGSAAALTAQASGLFGCPSSSHHYGEEAFGDEGDEEAAAAMWDLGAHEVERMRAAPSVSTAAGASAGALEQLGLAATPSVDGPAGKATRAVGLDGDDEDGALGPLRLPLLGSLPASPRSPGSPARGGTPASRAGSARVGDEDGLGALPATPSLGGGSLGGGEGGGLSDATGAFASLPPTPLLGTEDDARDDARGGADKTYVRRSARAEQGAAAGAPGGEDAAKLAGAAKRSAAAAAARQARRAASLGKRRRMVVDTADESAQPQGQQGQRDVRRRAATELPGAELRALLMDRAPLLDTTRGKALWAGRGARAAPLASDLQQQETTGGCAALVLPPIAPSGSLLPPQLTALFAQTAAAAVQRTAPLAALTEIQLNADDGGVSQARADGGSLSLSLGTDPRVQGQVANVTPGSCFFDQGGSWTPAGFTPGSCDDVQQPCGPPQVADGGDAYEAEDACDADVALPGSWDDALTQHGGAGDVQLSDQPWANGSLISTQEPLVWPADAETLVEADAAAPDGAPSNMQLNGGGFTSRTRLVLRHLQAAAARSAGGAAATGTPTPASTGRARRIAAPPPLSQRDSCGVAGTSSSDKLSLGALTRGAGRLDAARVFYELLVLGSAGVVRLSQPEPYGDVAVALDTAAMARAR